MELTYATYLKVEELLALQQPRSDPEEHDELLFIIVHQAYELWFKLLLHEMEKVRTDLFENRLYGAISTFKRMRSIVKTMVEQIDIVETLTPMSFNSFRDRLETASGFQSTQFREFEFLLGYKRKDVLKYHAAGSPAHERMMRRLHEPSVYDGFYAFLQHQGVAMPPEIFRREPTSATAGNDQVAAGVLKLYTTRPDIEILFELMTDLDEGIQEWRYRHIKLVERTIGSKQGTGGSPGIEFLKKSLFQPVFPDLWSIRHQI